MTTKINALAEIAPEKVIEMYAGRLDRMSQAGRTVAIEYLRSYATVYYSPETVPANIAEQINALEAKSSWPVAQ